MRVLVTLTLSRRRLMRRVALVLSALALLLAAPVSLAREAPVPVPRLPVLYAQGNAPFLRSVGLDVRVAFARADRERAAFAPDTLVMTATWTGPIDDGRGGIDSLRIRFAGIMNDTSYIFKTFPLPTSQVRRHIIPAAAYGSSSGASASYDVYVEATTYRRGSNPPPLKSTPVSITLVDPAPPNVTGLTFTAVKRP